MNNEKSVKIITILSLILSLICLGISGLALNKSLHVTSEAVIPTHGSTWRIVFTNPRPGVTTGSAERGHIYLSSTNVTISNVILKEAGDSVTYIFDVENRGRLNAELANITKKNGYVTDRRLGYDDFECTLTYADGSPLKLGDKLKVGHFKTLKYTITLKNGSSLRGDKAFIDKLGYVLVYRQSNQ